MTTLVIEAIIPIQNRRAVSSRREFGSVGRASDYLVEEGVVAFDGR